LRSSALIGGSSAINIGIGIVRTKVMAILLGPAGFGLFGLYGSVSDLALSVAGMGVNSSGVRQIADAVGSGDMERIARTTIVLRRASLLLGVLGAALLALFSQRISRLTFGTAQHATAICLLGAAVLLRLISAGQTALIQGLRRISDLARLNVFGAAFGTVSAIALVSWLGQDGIVLSLVAVAAAMIVPPGGMRVGYGSIPYHCAPRRLPKRLLRS
jgi:PST family polysaccharide transporter